MAKPASLVLGTSGRALYWAEQAAIVVSASLVVPSVPASRCLCRLPRCLDPAEFWRPAGGSHSREPPRICCDGGLPDRRSKRDAGFQSCRARRHRSTARGNGRILAGVPLCGCVRGLDYGTRQSNVSYAPALPACWLKLLLFAGGLSWLAVITHSFMQAYVSGFIGLSSPKLLR